MDGEPTTLVKVGWLWFDDDFKSSLEDKIVPLRRATRHVLADRPGRVTCIVARWTSTA